MIAFDLPTIIPYNKGKLKVKKIVRGYHLIYKMFIDGEQFMEHRNDNQDVYYTISHCLLAKGDVITTGLGFGIREKMLLENPNVKSVTVLEISPEIIEYHNEVNPDLMNNIRVINCDANSFTGACNTLLIDHYEKIAEDKEKCLDIIKKCANNIKHDLLWYWPLERHIENITEYQAIKKEIPTLPKLSKLEFESLKHIYHSKDDVYEDNNSK